MALNTRRKLVSCVAAIALIACAGRQARAIEFANIDVVGTNNATTVPSIAQGTPGFFIHSINNFGDYAIRIGGSTTDDWANGVLITGVRENGRGGVYATSFTAEGLSWFAPGGYFIPVSPAPAGGEANANVAAAYFPFSEGWSVGHATNSTNGGPITTVKASAGINLGTEFIDNGNGQFQLTIPGVQSRNDGVLLVTGGKNEDNYAQSMANADGSWTIYSHDNGANAWAFEQDPVAFAFVPYGTPGVVSGQIVKDTYGAGILNGSGAFSVLDQGTGQVRLTIPGQDPTTGVLVVSPEGGTALNVDNIVTYQADGSGWLLQTRDITGMGLQNLQEGEAMASFAFIPFSGAPTAPGSRTRIDVDGAVSAGNVEVTEFSSGNSGGAMTAVVTESTGQVFVQRANRGDIMIAVDGHRIDPTTGVLLATSREDDRDNSATGGVSGRATMDPFKPGNATAGWTVSTHGADGTNPGEMNIDMAVAYFPYAQGWEAAANAPTSGGTATLSLPGAGDTRGSGVLLINAYGNDDNFATASPTADGTGWTVQVRDNSSSLEGDGFNYAYLPYGTENLIAGHVAQNGDIMDRTSTPFSVTRESAGNYRLSIPGESPQTGMLLLTATQERYSNDNFLTYTADGNDFIIHGIDSQSGVAARPNHDTYFNFAFISFDNPPTDPKLRAAPDPRIAVGAKIKVSDDNYPRAAVIQSTAYIGLNINAATNSGDYAVALDGTPLHQSDGVMIATARDHIRGSYRGVVSVAGQLTQGTPYNANNDMWIAVHRNSGAAPEHNVDVAAGWFPFAGNWTSGHVDRFGNLITGFGVEQSMFTKLSPGHHELRMPGIDSRNDGILLAVGAGNGEDNVMAAAPFSDGSGWDIVMRDNDGNYDNSEGDGNYDAWSFVYVPYDLTQNLVAAGRVDDDGSLLNAAGLADVSVTRDAAGQYTLSIDGWSADDGILLLTESKMGFLAGVGSRAEDNWLTYQEDAFGNFSINSYDLPGEGFQDSEFVFLFLPTTGELATFLVPEPTTCALLGLGLLALARRRRRKRG